MSERWRPDSRLAVGLALILLGVLFFAPSPACAAAPRLLASVHKWRPSPPERQSLASTRARYPSSRILRYLSAKSAVVLDAGTGEVLFARNPDMPRQPASTIKILTGLIALESLDPRAKVTVSRRAARMPRSKVYLEPGKWYWAGDLVDAVLLASANDASVALAEWIAGSERAFARKMTAKARQLGARNTVCRTASGLTARGQYSTARDLAVMFGQVMRHPEFARRVSRAKKRAGFGRTLVNHNKALWRIRGAVGGKTGYTRAARQTYVGKFERNGRALIVAIMGSEAMWDDVERLVRYGFARLRRQVPAPPAARLAGARPASSASIKDRVARLRAQLHQEAGLAPVRILSAVKKTAPRLSL